MNNDNRDYYKMLAISGCIGLFVLSLYINLNF